MMACSSAAGPCSGETESLAVPRQNISRLAPSTKSRISVPDR